MLPELTDVNHLPLILDEARTVERACRDAYLLAHSFVTPQEAAAMPAIDAAIWTFRQGWITWRQLRLVHEVNRPVMLLLVEMLEADHEHA